ncbi:inhibitor of KinA [Paenibacillus endophyticus]|uniref:Inhibitor of KinA n=1 Tax=Paenibacillus endophyticus TaxID=1294268 RepID=A0A7W5CBF3_9BACL|nr:5-oxoprolinase subunit PxpB [Paenibacillus endophyticus]MBB3153709.1 inhibitor of KinA [Paenibacillus endophyticus]
MEKQKQAKAWSLELLPLGDAALLMRVGSAISIETRRRVQMLAAAVEAQPFTGYRECVPSFAAVAVHYDPLLVRRSRSGAELAHETVFETVSARMRAYLEQELPNEAAQSARTIEIPVCYGGEYGPDLAFVAKHNGITEQEVVAIHSDAAYLVYMLGFAPGFPYLGGMSERIAAPRRQTPRTSIPQGSVGIAGKQTGVYSVSTPGGWQLIGRTPLALFRPQEPIPSLLRPGDSVRFKPIASEEYMSYLEGER